MFFNYRGFRIFYFKRKIQKEKGRKEGKKRKKEEREGRWEEGKKVIMENKFSILVNEKYCKCLENKKLYNLVIKFVFLFSKIL